MNDNKSTVGIDTKTRAKQITVEQAWGEDYRALLVMATDAERKEIVACAYSERDRAALTERAKRMREDAEKVQLKADAIAPDRRKEIAEAVARRMLLAASGVVPKP